MNLLRIGRDTVNMDQVLSIYETGEKYILRFGHGEHGNEHHQVQVLGEDREAFARWLDANATNLTPNTEMDQEWEAYKAKGGDMSRSMFEANVECLRSVNKELDNTNIDLEPARWKRLADSAATYEKRLLY